MTTLYEKDFCGWSLQQSDLLKRQEFSKLDMQNLIEEIESLGRSEKRTLESHLEVFLTHLLKKKIQPEKHTRSWDLSIKYSRCKALRILKDNPSLKSKLYNVFESAYESARLNAARETRLDENLFPEECPWAIEEILDTKQGG